MNEQREHGEGGEAEEGETGNGWNFGSGVRLYSVSVTKVTRLKKQAPF